MNTMADQLFIQAELAYRQEVYGVGPRPRPRPTPLRRRRQAASRRYLPGPARTRTS